MTFIHISKKSPEQIRFYYGWATLACFAGVALLTMQVSGNFPLALSVFFIGFGIALLMIGASKPILPLILLSGGALMTIGLLILGIFVVLVSAITLIGIVLVAVSGGVIWFVSKRGGEND